jgi:hypothetical protein
MTARVTVDDLLGAADWLRAYEDDHGRPIGDVDPAEVTDERAIELLRVAEWLDAEVARRRQEQTVRAVAKRSGVSSRRARAAVRRAGASS